MNDKRLKKTLEKEGGTNPLENNSQKGPSVLADRITEVGRVHAAVDLLSWSRAQTTARDAKR